MSGRKYPDVTRLSTMRDRLVTRCGWCGDWRYGSRACDTCGTAAPETKPTWQERSA